VSDKTGWEGRGQQLGAHIGTVWTLSQALGQAKKNMRWNPERVYDFDLLGAKTEILANWTFMPCDLLRSGGK